MAAESTVTGPQRACVTPGAARDAENRGLVWLMGGFLFCPCHLPLTVAVAGALLSGTAAAAFLRDNIYLAAAVSTLLWLAASWRGIRLLRSARAYARSVAAAEDRSAQPQSP